MYFFSILPASEILFAYADWLFLTIQLIIIIKYGQSKDSEAKLACIGDSLF